ncbi:MAG: hypothetical protein KGK16_05490 [Bradyrhizobium sp.]|nr:hypothetical protein [Bradyrhizobium sp.]
MVSLSRFRAVPGKRKKAPAMSGAFVSLNLSGLFRQQARELPGRPQAANFIDPPGKQNRAGLERLDFLFLRVGFLKFCDLFVEGG